MSEMKISSWSKTFGIIGYILLVVGATFLHAPILALGAIPILIVSIVLCTTFLFSLSNDQVSNKKWLGAFLIIVGIIGFYITIGYAAYQYADYLVASSRNVIERFYPSPWKVIFVFKVLAADIIATSIITLGIKQRTGWEGKRIRLAWSAIFLSAPITIAMVRLLELLGVPLCT